MARKSRKRSKQTANTDSTMQSTKNMTAIYGRLSVEDNNHESGDSLQNQITYLEEFVEKNREELQLTGIYIDNGATGTNFERSGWQAMIADIKSGKVHCIVVKDFSRIGRNYIEVGNYLEKIFPFLNVRVISVNDGFDSKKQTFENNLLMNSLTNIVNEYYARDISRKVLQAKKVMQSNGEYTSGIYPYGYRRSRENKRKMEVDPEAAVVVQKIFRMRISGKSCSWIAKYLNDLAIASPGLYRYMKGGQSFEKCRESKWKAENVSGILVNPVYLGHTVQGKSKHSHFKNNGKKERVPRKDWVIIENTHQPLIEQEQFDIAADMAMVSRRKYEKRMSAHADIPHIENPLGRKVFCGKCGSRMFRRSKVENGVRNYCYYCDARRRKLNTECSQSYIREERLMSCIKGAAEKQLQLLGKWQRKQRKHSEEAKTTQKSYQKADRQKHFAQEIACIKNKKKVLYEDMKTGMLQQEDFRRECEVLSRRQMQCEQEIKALEDNAQRTIKAINTLQDFSEEVFALKSDKIPVELLDILIEKIEIFSMDHIEITYSYSDTLGKLLQTTQENHITEEGKENERKLSGKISPNIR